MSDPVLCIIQVKLERFFELDQMTQTQSFHQKGREVGWTRQGWQQPFRGASFWGLGTAREIVSAAGTIGGKIGLQRIQLVHQLFHVILKKIPDGQQAGQIAIFVHHWQMPDVLGNHQ